LKGVENMTDQELKDLIAGLAKAQTRTDEQLAKTDVQLERLTKKFENMGDEVRGIGKSQGLVAEEFFYNSLAANPVIGQLRFDHAVNNLQTGKGNSRVQFDTVLFNGNSVAIIEVKYRARPEDLDQLDKQVSEFRERFKPYANFNFYAGIAGFNVPDEVVNQAHQKGYFVLKRTGDVFAVDTEGMREV
jgi:hypothetical protein